MECPWGILKTYSGDGMIVVVLWCRSANGQSSSRRQHELESASLQGDQASGMADFRRGTFSALSRSWCLVLLHTVELPQGHCLWFLQLVRTRRIQSVSGEKSADQRPAQSFGKSALEANKGLQCAGESLNQNNISREGGAVTNSSRRTKFIQLAWS